MTKTKRVSRKRSLLRSTSRLLSQLVVPIEEMSTSDSRLSLPTTVKFNMTRVRDGTSLRVAKKSSLQMVLLYS